MEKVDLNFTVDTNIVQNIGQLVRQGTPISEFERALVKGKYDEARQHAPGHILSFKREDLVANMIRMFSLLPKVFRESDEAIDNWISWGGFSTAPEDIQMLFILEWDDNIFGEFQGLGKTFFT